MKLDKKVKAKWVKALRSGKYRQGRGKLLQETPRGENLWCCLGVLGHTLGIESVSLLGAGVLPEGRKMPLSLEWQRTFATMNDGEGPRESPDGHEIYAQRRWSFVKIADWIEKHL